jgi:hypothetical protein
MNERRRLTDEHDPVELVKTRWLVVNGVVAVGMATPDVVSPWSRPEPLSDEWDLVEVVDRHSGSNSASKPTARTPNSAPSSRVSWSLSSKNSCVPWEASPSPITVASSNRA